MTYFTPLSAGERRSRSTLSGWRGRRARVLIALAGLLAALTPDAFAGHVTEPPTDPTTGKTPTTPEPVATDPQLNDASVDRQLDAMRRKNGPTKSVAPKSRTAEPSVQPPAGQSADPVPGMAASDFGVPGARRLREGAFISRRPGTLLKIPNGDWVFVPRPLAGSKNEGDAGVRNPSLLDRPLVVLPSQTLDRLENSMGTLDPSGERPAVVLSGQIFTYRDREYVLPQQPSALISATEQSEIMPRDVVASDHAGVKSTPARELEDASVKDLIRDLEVRRAAPRALTASGTTVNSKPRAAAQNDPSSKPASTIGGRTSPGSETPVGTAEPVARAGDHAKMLVPEGTILSSRRGRVVRLAGGELAFSVESDGQSGSDPAMILLPSATLQRLEDLILWRGERQVVEVSGRVTSYGGKNYLMPTIFVVPPPTELGPMQ